jgi:anti-anti-sigma regulatory factor
MKIDKDAASGGWKLSGALCIDDAQPLREALLGCFADSGAVILDVGAVSECDTTGVQLLIAAQRTAALQGRAFRIEHEVEGPVVRLAESLGLALEMVVRESDSK